MGASASLIVNEEFDDVKYEVNEGESAVGFENYWFNDQSHYCARNRIWDNTGYSIAHGTASCYTRLADKSTGATLQFDLDADSVFDFSFTADRISYGTNYSSNIYLVGLFSMSQVRGSADSIWLADGTKLGASTTVSKNYRIQYSSDGLKFYTNNNLVYENLDYEITNPFTTHLQVRVNNARYYLKDLNFVTYDELTEEEVALKIADENSTANAVGVPEPSSMAMFGIGGLLMLLRRKQRA
tara:strand:+ start:9712 stop:10434 length:723 start_codon:yes stop_codon:yes gene_type:complete